MNTHRNAATRPYPNSDIPNEASSPIDNSRDCHSGRVDGASNNTKFKMPNSNSPSARTKKTHFSLTSELITFGGRLTASQDGDDDKSTANNYNSWITKQDRQEFKRTFARDRYRVARVFASTPMQDITAEQLYECIGLEAVLSLDVAMRISELKRRHIRTILFEQARQRAEGGSCDDEEIARISKRSSCKNAERAHKLAKRYFNFLKE